MSKKETISNVWNYFQLNDNENTFYQPLGEIAIAKDRWKYIGFKVHIKYQNVYN